MRKHKYDVEKIERRAVYHRSFFPLPSGKSSRNVKHTIMITQSRLNDEKKRVTSVTFTDASSHLG